MSKIIPLIQLISKRTISVSAPREGKRNFRKFVVANKRGSRLHKQKQNSLNPELPVDKRGVRDTGYILNGRFVTVPEMIPELIVPDLKGCDLKPYVSYKAADVIQSEFTPQQLFDAVYSKKIVTDFKQGKLDKDGKPLEPSEDEKLEPEEAVARAKRTGSDIF
ncbi:39S ribosomal protein L41, mitochondrial [Pectinophora gossypiella]|uniref:39S ribosomal protein L41, mitochondrial n=1 Tax=Pectinophora gossypiella TaxID=13191 RepID=A0A1E1WEY4_PECGO|nr:39S ribosomal protein L41, mitochondrial [Pectinophora gossypiella]